MRVCVKTYLHWYNQKPPSGRVQRREPIAVIFASVFLLVVLVYRDAFYISAFINNVFDKNAFTKDATYYYAIKKGRSIKNIVML